jgi:hypothetical protein
MEEIRSSETSVLKEPHGVTSQKTVFFIVTAVKTANLTENLLALLAIEPRFLSRPVCSLVAVPTEPTRSRSSVV